MLQLARLEEQAGRIAEAQRWLDKAAGLHGKALQPRLALHGLYLRSGQAQRSLEAAREAQALAPNHPGTLLALAQSQVAVGKTEMARTTLRRLTQVASFNASWLTQAAAGADADRRPGRGGI